MTTHVCPHESRACDPGTRLCHLCLQDQCAEEDRRARVVETARLLLAAFAAHSSASVEFMGAVAFRTAEDFEKRATEYQAKGK